jgi:DNA-binding response OmpR family regulator
MAKPLSNRAPAGEHFRQKEQDYQLLIRARTAKALVASLTLRHGNLELDRLSRTCRIKGRRCPLTRREYELLSFLLLNRGQVWSRDQLTKHAWQREPYSINLVAVNIVNLRKKLGPSILRTVRGQGYIIDPENKGGRLSIVGRGPRH